MTDLPVKDVEPEEVVFETSGSTGPAHRWVRTLRQMQQEVEMITACTVGAVDFVINYSPPRHLFGALFGQCLPELRSIPAIQAWKDPFRFPDIPNGARVLVVCVPMTWDLLRRNWRKLEATESVAALHSSAAPPVIAHALIDRTRLTAHEILGSTETGGIAHRLLDPHESWQVLPDVTVLHDEARSGPQRLVVRSPRLARLETDTAPPDDWATGDLVEFTGTGAFRLVGREAAMIKVNGLKLHLSRVQQQLDTRVPSAECVPVPVPHDPLTGEGYAVFWARRGSSIGSDDVRGALEGFPSPASVIEMPVIPTTRNGKPDLQTLAGMLAGTAKTPLRKEGPT